MVKIESTQAVKIIVPQIDPNRCEGKAACVAVCPVSVFALSVLPKSERGALTLRGKVKGFVHGWRQAAVLNPNACEACGRCVQACPENAITLVRIDKTQ